MFLSREHKSDSLCDFYHHSTIFWPSVGGGGGGGGGGVGIQVYRWQVSISYFLL